MKTVFSTILFFALTLNISAQIDQFAPIGAEWNTYYLPIEKFGEISYGTISVTEEVTIEDKVCSVASGVYYWQFQNQSGRFVIE